MIVCDDKMMSEKPNGVRDVPKSTYFKYPEGMKLEGMVVKEVGKIYKNSVIGDYYAIVQLIEHPNEEDCVRFGYYRKKPGTERFRWASQTTYEFPVSLTKELIKMAEEEGIL